MRTRNTLMNLSAAAVALLALAVPGVAHATSFTCSPPVQNGKVRTYTCVVDLPCQKALKTAAELVQHDGAKGTGVLSAPTWSSASANSCHVSWTLTKTGAGWIQVRTKFKPEDKDDGCYHDWFKITPDLLAMHVVPGQGEGAVRTAMLSPDDHDLHLPVGGPVGVQLRSHIVSGTKLAWLTLSVTVGLNLFETETSEGVEPPPQD